MSGTEFQEKMMTNEGHYDAIPYVTKEMAGFPTRYIYLSSDQKELIDSLLESSYKSKKELDLQEDLSYIRDITTEVSELSDAILRRYGVNK